MEQWGTGWRPLHRTLNDQNPMGSVQPIVTRLCMLHRPKWQHRQACCSSAFPGWRKECSMPGPHCPAPTAPPRSPAWVLPALVTPSPGCTLCGPSSPPEFRSFSLTWPLAPLRVMPRLAIHHLGDCRSLKKCGILSLAPGPLSQESSFWQEAQMSPKHFKSSGPNTCPVSSEPQPINPHPQSLTHVFLR